jgi:hypothetical protein
MDTGRGDTAPTFSGLHVYLHFTWDVCLPTSPVEFSSLRLSHKVSRTWLLGMHPGSHPLRPGLACLFTVLGRIPLPAFSSQGAPPSLLCVFIFLIAYYSSNKQYCLSNIAQAIFLFFSLFSLGGGQSVQRAILIWPRDVCGSTAYRLAHFVHVFPSRLGMGDWRWPGGPPGFTVQREVRCSVQAGGVEGSKFCLFSVALPARCVSNISP